MNVVKTSGREFFYLVSGLMVPKYMVSEKLAEEIERFIDWVQRNTDGLLTSSATNMPQFINEMEKLYTMLCTIHAHWLEMEAAKILRLTEINGGELTRELVVPFITNIRTLAMDIQMAQKKGFDNSYLQRNDIERYKDIINSMKIIAILLRNKEYEKAFDIAISINELQDGEYSIPLLASITSKNTEQAKKLVDEIVDVYTKRIESVITTTTETYMLKTIVIVDDMPEILTALSLILKGHFQVFAFPGGSELLTYLDKKQQADAFVLDIDMPHMDGFTLAKKIRARDKFAQTPILFLTSNSTRETFMRSLLYDAKAFIVKPVDKDIIVSKLNGCLLT